MHWQGCPEAACNAGSKLKAFYMPRLELFPLWPSMCAVSLVSQRRQRRSRLDAGQMSKCSTVLSCSPPTSALCFLSSVLVHPNRMAACVWDDRGSENHGIGADEWNPGSPAMQTGGHVFHSLRACLAVCFWRIRLLEWFPSRTKRKPTILFGGYF